MNPNSLANLRLANHKGRPSPNPHGRPKLAFSITEALRKVSEMSIDDHPPKKGMTYAQAAALVHWQAAVKGDLETYNFITSRLEGKPKETVDITTKGESIGNNGKVIIPEQHFTDALVILAAAGVSKN